MTEAKQVSTKPKRRWLRFGLRTMLVLVFLLALPLAWITYEVRDVRHQREAIDAIEAGGGYVYPYLYHREETNRWQAFRLRLLRKLFGEEDYPRIRVVQLVEPQQVNTLVPLLSRFPYLEQLTLPSATLDDRSVQVIATSPNLRELELVDTGINVEQMKILTRSPTITEVTLQRASASDSIVGQLPQLAALTEVIFVDATTTDHGMSALGQCRQLTSIEIHGAPQVTNVGFAALKNCPRLWNVEINGTQIDTGCIDTLREMPSLIYAVIQPDDPSTINHPVGKWRLDTFTPVHVKSSDDPFSDTAQEIGRDEEKIQVVTVEESCLLVHRLAVSHVSEISNLSQ